MNKPLYDPLKRLLSKINPELWRFAYTLPDKEQQSLYHLLQKVIEAEGGAPFSTLAVISGILPKYLSAKIAQEMLGPRMVARMTSYIPAKRAIAIAQLLRIDFLSEVAIHLEPDRVVEIIEGSPNFMLINICRKLLEKGLFDIVGAFSDHLSKQKLKVLSEKLDDPHGLVQIAQKMQNKERIIETAVQFSDEYLFSLMDGISYFKFYELASTVGQSLELDRQINILKKLSPSVAAELAAHYTPENIAGILDKIDLETALH
jgi:hypothetical protein